MNEMPTGASPLHQGVGQPPERASECGLTECAGQPMCVRCRHIEHAEKAPWPHMPKQPPPGLLMSMALRYDHALGIPGYYDELGLPEVTHSQRLSATLEFVGQHDQAKTLKQLGTLGGGNHFIELCRDEAGAVWVMLHSGSRHIGKTIGETAITMAKEVAVREDRRLADRDLAWLDEGSAEFEAYIEGMHWAQEYAAHNRALMLHAVLKVLREAFGRDVATSEHAVNCHHNFTRAEIHFGERMWVTRKGAVSAAAGELGIIPGSMGARSFIVRGLGNADAYCSCSHGAGRRMSRGEAKRRFSLTDLVDQTNGVECRKDEGVLDEIPGAYKDIDVVMQAQADLVKVEHTLKQVLCIKG